MDVCSYRVVAKIRLLNLEDGFSNEPD